MTDTQGGAPPDPRAAYPSASHPQPQGQAPYGVPPAGATPPGHYPYGQQPYAGYAPHLYGQPGGPPGFGRRDPNARPGTVLAAGIVAIVMSGSVFLVGLFSVIVGSALVALDDDLGLDREIALNALWMVWSAAAIVTAGLALRRSNGGRIALLVSSGATIVAGVVAIVTGMFGAVIPLLAAVSVIVLLLVGGATEWYRGRHDSELAPGD